jgi:xylulokinase
MREEPHISAHTMAIRLPHDYLTERLTGEAVTDRGDASGTAWWSTATEAYADEVLSLPAMELPVELLPRVASASDWAGRVTPAAAAETGLPAAIPVGPGTGDNMAAALGLGLRPGAPVLSLGTSGTVFMVSDTRVVDASGNVAGFADAAGRFLPLACTLNCTLAVDRVAAWLGLGRDDVMPSNGVVALPYFDGERTPNLPDASAAVFGLRHDTDPKSILMATYEGAIIGLLDALEAIDACSSGVDHAAPLVLIGGGARSETWRQVVQRLSGRAVAVPEATEFVALGAAVQAAANLLHEAPRATAARWRSDRGTLLEPLERDAATITRHKRVRDAALGLIQDGGSEE